MSRFRLNIENRGELLLYDTIEELFRLSDSDLRHRVRGWTEKGLRSVILMTPVLSRTQEKRVERVGAAVTEGGMGFQVLSTESFETRDHAELARFLRRTLEEITGGSSLLFFNRLERKRIERLLAALLLEHNPRLSPRETIRRLTGRQQREPEDRFVYKYKEFVDPEYALRQGLRAFEPESDNFANAIAEPEKGEFGQPPGGPGPRVAARENTGLPEPPRAQDPPVPRETPRKSRGEEYRPSFLTLRLKLTGVFCLLLCAFAVGTIIITYRYFKNENDFIVQWYATGTADLLARRISSELDNLEHAARELPGAGETTDFTLSSDLARQGVVFAAVYRQARLGVKFEASGLPQDGTYDSLAMATGIMDFLRKKESELLAAARGDTRIVFATEPDGPGWLLLATPLGGQENRGIVVVTRAAVLFGPPEGGRVSVRIVRETNDHIERLNPYRNAPPLVDEDPVRRMFGGQPKGLTRQAFAGQEYLTAHRKLPRRPMGILVSVATGESGALLFQYASRNLPLVFIFLNLALFLFYLFARTITEPIRALVHTIRNFYEHGKVSEKLKIRSGDEIGELTHEVRRLIASGGRGPT